MSIGPLSTIVEVKFNGNYNSWVADFAARAKNVYPEWTELHSAIEHNHEIAGRMLDDASSKLYKEWLYTWRRNGLVVEQTR